MRPRIGEAVLSAWIGFAVAVWLASGDWRRGGMIQESAVYNWMFLFLAPVLAWRLLPLLVASARGLRATLALARGGDAASLASAVGLDGERRRIDELLRLLRDFLPVCLAVACYRVTDYVIDTVRGDELRDGWLIRADLLLFGAHPSVWMQRFVAPWLTEVLSLCYFFHMIVAGFVLLYLHARAPRERFVEAAQGFTTMLVLGCMLYALVPAVGPYVTLRSEYTQDLGGGTMERVNAAVIDQLRASRDAFPSLHVGLSGLLWLYAWRAERRLGLLLAPLVLGNWVSTLYLRYHYGVDVLAAAALVPLVDRAVRLRAAGATRRGAAL